MTPVQQALVCVALLCWSGWGLLHHRPWQHEHDEVVADIRDLGFPNSAWFLERLAPAVRFFDCFTFVCAAMALAGLALAAVFA